MATPKSAVSVAPPSVPLVAILTDDAERIYNYLLSRPYAEVEHLIPVLREAKSVVVT